MSVINVNLELATRLGTVAASSLSEGRHDFFFLFLLVFVCLCVVVHLGCRVARKVRRAASIFLSVKVEVAADLRVDIPRAVLVKFHVVTGTLFKDYNGDVNRTQYAELVRLLEEAILPL